MSLKTVFSGASSQTEDLPRVAIVTPTRRWGDPNSDTYKARYEGLISAYEQFVAQDYPADKLELRIADASDEPHPFFATLEDPRVKYLHVPERSEAVKKALAKQYPGSERFLMLDDELESADMRFRIAQIHSHCSRKTNAATGVEVPTIQDPLELRNPTIGMKRNVLCSLPFGEKNEKPEVVVSWDDDDWRSPNYIRHCVDNLREHAWTKSVNYHLAVFDGERKRITWAEKILDPVTDGGGAVVGATPRNGNAILYVASTGFNRTDPESAFSSKRWHSLSTDGAVHAFRYDAWERSVDLFGGYFPGSYNEDTMFFEALRLLGNLDDPKKVERSPAITNALMGLRKFSPAEIANDADKGTASINPDFCLRNDFARLCCANVSPVAFTGILRDYEVPTQMREQAFTFLTDTVDQADKKKIAAFKFA